MHDVPFSQHAKATFITVLCVLLSTAAPLSAQNENWPSFRGADALSTTEDDPRLPTSWSATENVVWKAPIEGLGWSSPVIWGNHIFLTTVISDGEIQEPRMGLYFPYGSPEPSPEFRAPEPGEHM